MKKIFLLKGLDCPHCSAKIEREVGELSGVSFSSVNLMKQTLTVEAESIDIKDIEKIVYSHEPDVKVSEKDINTKVFLLSGLDCPHCSAKIEREVGELSGVTFSNVNLIKQTLTIESEESIGINEIEKIVHSHEPEVIVSEYIENAQTEEEDDDDNKKMIARFIIGGVVFTFALIFKLPFAVKLSLFIVSYLVLGLDVVLHAVKNIIKGKVFDEHFLMSLSTIGAFIIGEYPEAVAVMLFYQIGEFFQDLSVERSRKSISDLMNIRPDSANVLRHGSLVTVYPENVKIGETIVVKAGERIALDGVVIEGESMLDTSALTGESVPKSAKAGDEVLSGCINQSGVLKINVSKEYGESTVSKIIDLVENASSRKAPTENFITKFARYYTPVVVILALVLALGIPFIIGDSFTKWIHRGLVFLVISCPCALVLSVPLAFFGGIGASSKHGVLVKGSNYLEALNDVKTVVFDKTGTLTKGVFKVNEIIENGFEKEEILEYAASAESLSNHPIAKSILASYGKELNKKIEDYKEISGFGISAVIDGKKVLAGNEKFMESENVSFAPCEKIGTKVYVAIDGKYSGYILINDEIKEDSKKTVSSLKALGVEKTVMLTGDNRNIAKNTANELKIDEYYAELLPDEKVNTLEKIGENKLAFVGDGINDAPVLARADVGIAMGAFGSDAAIEAADIVIMTDEPSKLIDAFMIAKYTRKIVIQNIAFSLLIKGIILLLGALGYAGMWEAVFADVGVAFLAVLNSMRILKK